MDAMRVERLGYTYPGSRSPALRAVNLAIDGGLTLLTGDSGSGKSTLLRVCNGLVPHFHGGVISGTALVFGQNVTRTSTRSLARDVGFVFQDPELQSVHARVDRDVAFGLENLRVPHGEMRTRVDEALQLCGVETLRERAVATLSGGERQRVALAGVLAMRPRLLALDEPLSQLDDDGAAALVTALTAAVQRGTAALVAEHRLALIRPIAHRSLHMTGGRLGVNERADDSPMVLGGDVTQDAGGAQEVAAAGVRVRDVTAGHAGVAVLHNVELTLHGGEVVALTGRNGSGKTTLLRTLAGVLTPLSGSVDRAPGRVAYLPQNPTVLLHRQTLRSEIEWTLRYDVSTASADSVLSDFGLAHVAQRYPRDLSTGERQRAALAAVLAGTPSLALLDEPTRGMDVVAAAQLARTVHELAARGAVVVVATHDQNLARRIATHVIEARDGGVSVSAPAAAASA